MREKIRMKAFVCCIGCAGVALWTGILSTEPKILWMSDPVKGGEAVEVFGAGLSNAVCRARGEICRVLRSDDESLVFVLPASCGTGEIPVTVGGTAWTLNRPTVWWTQNDPDGNVWEFGKCLGTNGWCRLKAAGASREGGRSDKVFFICDFGAVPSDRRDDTAAILAAVEAAKAAGGGTVLVPVGRFGMRGTINLPENCTLAGVSESASMIYWSDVDEPEGPFVVLHSHTGIRDLMLGGGNFVRGVVTEPEEGLWGAPLCRDVRLERVRTRFLHTDVPQAEGLRRTTYVGWRSDHAFRLAAHDLVVRDCDLLSSKGVFRFFCERGWLSGNRLRPMQDTVYLGGNELVFERNDCRGVSVSYHNGSRRGYFADNLLGDVYGPLCGETDRETFTFDHGRPCYYDFAVTEGRRVKLRHGTQPTDRVGGFSNFRGFARNGALGQGAREWAYHTIAIVAGKGRGQWRDFTIVGDLEVELKSPWTVEPDGTSVYCICFCHEKVLLVGNTVCDGNPFQAYGASMDVYFAGNTCYRNAGLNARAFFGNHPHVNWFVQFLGNEIADGCTLRGPASGDVPAKYSCIGSLAYSSRGTERPYALSLCTVMRGNRLQGGSCLAFTGSGLTDDPLVDSNFVKDNDVGILVDSPGVRGLTVWGNRFENIGQACRSPVRLDGDLPSEAIFPLPKEPPTIRATGWRVKDKLPLVGGNVLLSTNVLGCAASELRSLVGAEVPCAPDACVYARTTLTVTRRMEVRFRFDHRALKSVLFVDGKRLGSSSRRGAPGDVWLDPGPHRIEILKTVFNARQTAVSPVVSVQPFEACGQGEMFFGKGE